jgi:hypothetical protein
LKYLKSGGGWSFLAGIDPRRRILRSATAGFGLFEPTRIIVPNAKIKWDQGNPTGHGVIFLRSDDKWVYCYAPPGGV